MKERPILFSAPMIRAILENRKTQTRRIIQQKHLDWMNNSVENFLAGRWDQRPMPYGKPGDWLWVREAWQAWKEFDGTSPSNIPKHALERVNYLADGNKWDARYRHARFMPHWASRILLEITDVRVERLQDISEEDAIAEGLIRQGEGWRGATELPWYASPVGAYRSLWETINGAGSWESNPYVWVTKFKRVPS